MLWKPAAMKTYPVLLYLFLALFGLSGFAREEEEAVPSRKLLQEGLFAEEAEGKLEQAAGHYARILKRFEQERRIAVAALYRLAEVRAKQKRKEESVVLYRRIVLEFPKSDQAALSQEKLLALGLELPRPDRPKEVSPEETRELRRLMMVAENRPAMLWEDDPMQKAAKEGWGKVLSWLLEYARTSGHKIKRYPLESAAAAGHLDVCKLLMKDGAKIDEAGSALLTAIKENRDEVAEWLIAEGVDLNVMGRVTFKIKDPDEDRPGQPITSSRNKTPDLSRWGNCYVTPLAAAIVWENKHWVDRLLELKVDVNAFDENKTPRVSALSVACGKGHLPLVKKLLAAGADPNQRGTLISAGRQTSGGPRGWFPLHYAANHPTVVAALLEAGAKAAVTDASEVTPLHRACQWGAVESAKLLLKAGADPESPAHYRSAQGRESGTLTPLMRASIYWDVEKAKQVVDVLLEHGADVYAADGKGADVIGLCDEPAIRAHLVERFLYRPVEGKQVVRIAIPESGAVMTAVGQKGDEAVPNLARVLLDWSTSQRLVADPSPETSFFGMKWDRVEILRPRADGDYERIPVNVLTEGDYPSLQWGDLIEVRAGFSRDPKYGAERSALRRMLVRKNAILDPDVKREDMVGAWITKASFQALLASLPCRITLKLPNEEPQEIETKGGLCVWSPLGPFPNTSPTSVLTHALQSRGLMWDAFEVKRSEKNGGEVISFSRSERLSPRFYLLDGDTVTVTKVHKLRRAHPTIELIEAETKRVIYHVPVGRPTSKEGIEKHGLGLCPTLIQLLAEAYASINVRVLMKESPNSLARHDQALWYAFLEEPKDGKKPSQAEVLEALSGVVRSCYQSYPRELLPHPDLRVVRVWRTTESGEDSWTAIPLGEFIAACTDDTPAAECRSRDFELKPGDVVEIKTHRDRHKAPWNGFDEATNRFFAKTLSVTVKVQQAGREPHEVSVKWTPPQYFQTTAGTIALNNEEDGGWISRVNDVVKRVVPQRKNWIGSGGWVREGATIMEAKKTKIGRPPVSIPGRSAPIPSRVRRVPTPKR